MPAYRLIREYTLALAGGIFALESALMILGLVQGWDMWLVIFLAVMALWSLAMFVVALRKRAMPTVSSGETSTPS
jgi:hypothetical protein